MVAVRVQKNSTIKHTFRRSSAFLYSVFFLFLFAFSLGSYCQFNWLVVHCSFKIQNKLFQTAQELLKVVAWQDPISLTKFLNTPKYIWGVIFCASCKVQLFSSVIFVDLLTS